jgi:UDP-3-O-[3-hydroxymyristoyl] glucosamine N-acyltransferase
MDTSIGELVELLAARLVAGNAEVRISGFASLVDAQPGDLSFFSDSRHRQQFERTKASAVLVPENCTEFPVDTACLAVADPSNAFGQVVHKYGFRHALFEAGIHPTAVIGERVVANRARICVGAYAVIEDGVQIGDETEIGAGCFVGRDTRIGSQCKLFANSTVHVSCILGDRVILHSGVIIGTDGFGYEFVEGKHRKVPQTGIVQIDNDVEIGACTTVDRARFGRTWIGEGTKIDNLVQIAHNVVIGKHCIIVSQCGIAGSTTLGDYVMMAAQSGVRDHVSIGSQCRIGGRAGVLKTLPPGEATYLGYPATPAMEERRRLAASKRVPELLVRVKELERRANEANGANGAS